jgi:hypothetical protein
MCRGVARHSWTVKHLTETLVKKFHRRKNNCRAFNKVYKKREYFSHLVNHAGASFQLLKGRHPKLLVRRIKQKDCEENKLRRIKQEDCEENKLYNKTILSVMLKIACAC